MTKPVHLLQLHILRSTEEAILTSPLTRLGKRHNTRKGSEQNTEAKDDIVL